jgi:hypothetical protein
LSVAQPALLIERQRPDELAHDEIVPQGALLVLALPYEY